MPQRISFADLSFWPTPPSSVLLAMLLAVGLCPVCSVPVQAQRLLTAPTVQKGACFGTAVVATEDLNADDAPDVAVGAPREAVGEKKNVGRVHLFGGSDGEPLQSVPPPEPRMGRARFGTALAPLSNLGTAGSPGLMVGAPRDAVPRTGNRPGKTYVFDGSTAALRFALVSPSRRRTTASANPVQNRTTVSFAVKEGQKTTLHLYNVLGQRVATLYRGTPRAGELKTIELSVTDLPSGTYFLGLEAGTRTLTQRLTVVG
ncbi:MAG: T9SS type A sorting domain-containing protein [Salinibacter sp.]